MQNARTEKFAALLEQATPDDLMATAGLIAAFTVKDTGLLLALAELPEEERKVVGAYVKARTTVKGCGPDEMSPAELMQWLTAIPGEEAA